MKLFSLRLLLSLSILISLVLSSGCIGESSQSIPQEERTHSEPERDIPLSNQEEPKSSSNPTSDQSESDPPSPLPPISVWAIPFLSTREALQLYQMLDEDSKARAKELISIHGVEVIDQTLTSQECQDYFGEGGLFEHAKKINFQRSFIDVRCFEKLPRTLTELTFCKSQLIHQEMMFSEEIWVNMLENIAKTAPHLQFLSIDLKRKTDEMLDFQQKTTAVIAEKMISLRRLILKNTRLSDEGAKAIAQGNLKQLTHLDLSGNCIGSEGIGAIVTGNLANLTHLDLSFNKVGSKGALAIAHGKLEHLTHLDLLWNNIGDIGAEAIFQGNLPSLTHLDLCFNNIGTKGARATTLGNLENLIHLDLSWNKIESEGAIAIAHGNFESLTYLDLSWNKIDEEGIQAIHENLLPRLDYLDLSTNSIKENHSTDPKRIKGKIFKFLWD